jgi:Mn2+/Fe2+ NRAMP family transporter
MKSNSSSAILGAAFLMATSAIGPGFLTQTTVFTEKLGASFGFVILLSIALDIVVQLNIWRILCVRGQFAQNLANQRLKYSGDLLSILIVIGGLAFNIGNVAGAGLGLNAVFGIPVEIGAILSAMLAIGIFLSKEMGKAIDGFSKILGLVMFVLIFYVVLKVNPPVFMALKQTLLPSNFDAIATITLVGGTVGGYITFAGAHRLVDAGVVGVENLKGINRGATQGILLTGVIRFLLFLAVFGVISLGLKLDASNPPASVFQLAAGNIGYKLFGFLIWAAAITSIVGSAYTSVSFIKTMHTSIEKNQKAVIMGFIGFSTLIFCTIGKPVSVLVYVGFLNGLVLPISLGIILLAAYHSKIEAYQHPKWLAVSGWIVVILMSILSIKSIWF